MTVNPNIFTQYFEKPQVSVFDRSKPVSFDLQIGQFVPAYWELTGFGDNAKGRTGHKLRLAPMIAPNFANLRFQEHTIAVPLRTILTDFQEKFNFSKNLDGASLPTISCLSLIKFYQFMGEHGVNPIGSLFDFLGYPVFADFFDCLQSVVNNPEYFRTATLDATSPFDPGIFNLTRSVVPYRNFEDINIAEITPVFGFYKWACTTYSDLTSYANAGSPSGSDFVRFLGDGHTMSSLTDSYLSYLFTKLLSSVLLAQYDSDSLFMEQEYSLLPLMAYHRAVADWNKNSNLVDIDRYIEDYVYSLKSNIINVYQIDELDFLKPIWSFANRLYDNDFWTSQLPTSSAGDAITIPANATVLDLAGLSALQKMMLKLSYSSRFRDQIWNLFNIKVDDAWLQQSIVIRAKTHNVAIGETIQTSETTTSSVLGSFSGRGYSAGTNKGYHIFTQEPCVLLNFVSLVASPSYADALHPLIKVDNILDFPLPGMDVLGNQPVRADLLSGFPGDSAYVFGYSRQYMEWLHQIPTVHGRMKTSLRYWNLTRRFFDTPVLNESFVEMSPMDDFDDIFSVSDSSHAFVDMYYDCKVTRPVHRSVRIII